MDKRTPAQWVEYLGQEHQPITLSEFMAGCLSRILGCLQESTAATQHMEGMFGSLDDMLGKSNPAYPSSGKVRAALDAQRDADRALAAEERAKRLGEGQAA